MFELVAITNRRLFEGEILDKIAQICDAGFDKIILREKDLSEFEYEKLAANALKITQNYETKLILHTFKNVALNLGADLHLKMDDFLKFASESSLNLSVSIHSLEDALKCAKFGPKFMIYGHIFETACKADLKPRGVRELEEIAKSVQIPIFAIGGINQNNFGIPLNSGAKGICLMSLAMQENAKKLTAGFKK